METSHWNFYLECTSSLFPNDFWKNNRWTAILRQIDKRKHRFPIIMSRRCLRRLHTINLAIYIQLNKTQTLHLHFQYFRFPLNFQLDKLQKSRRQRIQCIRIIFPQFLFPSNCSWNIHRLNCVRVNLPSIDKLLLS